MEPVSLATGLISGIQTCLHAYRVVSACLKSMRNMGNDVADLEDRILEAESRLWIWGRTHRLVLRDDERPNFSELNSMPEVFAEIIDKRLLSTKEYLESANRIVAQYGAVAISELPTRYYRLATHSSVIDKFITPEQSIRVSRTELEQKRRKEALQRTSRPKKILWAMRDKEKFRHAVEGLERCNDVLYKQTSQRLRILLYEAVASRGDYSGPVAEPGPDEAGTARQQHKAINEAIDDRMRQEQDAQRLVLQLAEESQEQKFRRQLEASRLKGLAQLTLEEKPERTRMTLISDGKEERVLVEWKRYDLSLIDRNEMRLRMSDVVGMLNFPPTFLHNVLKSYGFFEHNRLNAISIPEHWIGVVYQMPAIMKNNPDIAVRTLAEMLPAVRDEENKTLKHEDLRPPLGDRFRLASGLAGTLLSIHNCGWLHKGLRPENVVFISRQTSITMPYLMGWEYSRPAQRGQKTETVISSGSELELYQHPDWFKVDRDSSSGEARYRKEFDQYQLGCVLLEIGRWRSLADLRQSCGRQFGGEEGREAWREYLLTQARKLKPDMGAIYAKVVTKLLRGLDANGRNEEFWDAVVLQLSQCNA
ncbi:hypothetical protein BU26DRAFT_517904 [Trematosphaeria pertusa]|uniref:Prion-inhibition and propagation HeLo domain-containing protein n=1 Tax=Trematosphaeria pertusa TaxID=390896 RepID=A0A6A6ILU4_9PLEO|nr:uncharacterized protein BU26DRAFT_517904 [Trematosphaeria pertusa]KAF2251189.1 hypothetical protein BU26DRAFT_517904 [Trematosphaeria pertusa]